MEEPVIGYIAQPKDYWIASNAISITLNALGDANRIHGNVVSGAVIMCFINEVKSEAEGGDEGNGDGLYFGVDHAPKRWPLNLSPTYFNTNTAKYVYAAIPRSMAVGTQAVVVFPSEKLDIYGRAERTADDGSPVAVQVGSSDYFYIYLQAIISAPKGSPLYREWTQDIETGKLDTPEGNRELTQDTEWYSYANNLVTILKDITMKPDVKFQLLRARILNILDKFSIGGHDIIGVAESGVTPEDSNDTIVTPSYLDEFGNTRFLSKTDDDVAEGEIGFLKGLWVKAKGLFGIDTDGNAAVNNLQAEGNATIGGTAHVGADAIVEANGRVKGELNVDGNITGGELIQAMRGWFDELQSQNFSGHSGIGSGWGITNDYNGKSRMTIDELLVRGRFIIEELLVKRKEVTAGDQIFTCAANRIALVRYFNKTEGATVDDGLMGYEKSTVPWLLNMKRLLSGDLSVFGKIFSLEKNIYVGVRQEDLRDVKRIRCYFLAYDGDRRVDNLWKVGDLALCHTYNLTDINREYEAKHGNIHWWRRVVDVSKATSIVEGKEYHWFDVLYSQADNHLLTNDWEEDSDIPFTGDDAVQFGHFPTDDDFDANGLKASASDRMNAAAIEVNGAGNEDAPCYKLMFGIYTFSLSKCWYGGPVARMSLSPKTGYKFYGPHFEFITADNKPIHTVIDRAEIEWSKIAFEKDALNTLPSYSDDVLNGDGTFAKRGDSSHTYDKTYVRKVWFYERVSHKGSLWVCVRQSVSRWLRKTDGQLMPETWHPTPSVNIDDYESILTYCTSEPSLDSRDWQRQVSKGTSIIEEEVAYAASLSGVTHPTEGWKVVGTGDGQYATDDAAIAATGIKPGQYLWTRKKTIYSDTLQPTYQYSVNRWGIDGDGIASINSYFYGTNEVKSMPADDNDLTWYDTFAQLVASVTGGLARMQGWYIWEKTVIRYDMAANPDGTPVSKPDLVSYQCNRLGVDGQIGQEEYYCLRESDVIEKAFKNGTSDGGINYCGIQWYNNDYARSDGGRLKEVANPIDTTIWKTTRPQYQTGSASKFLWNFEQRVNGQGTQYATRPICIGDASRGIVGIIELYALSVSQTPVSASVLVPADINAKNTYGTIPTSGFNDKQVWADERYDRAPTEALPYQWNWTRILYSAPKNAADTALYTYNDVSYPYEDHYHVSAVRGTNGEDGAGEESIYILANTVGSNNSYTGTLPKNIAKGTAPNSSGVRVEVLKENQYDVDDYVPDGWSDNPQGISPQYPYEFVSTRKLGTADANGRKKWGDFSTPVLRSNWGKNGVDGDGVEYVFMRTKNFVAPIIVYPNVEETSGRTYLDDDYLPTISNKDACNAESTRCTDDNKDISREWPYEWAMKRTKGAVSQAADTYGQRSWNQYGGNTTALCTMSLWKNYAENAIRLDIDNEMDMVPTSSMGVVTEETKIVTKATMYDGAKEVTMKSDSFTIGAILWNGLTNGYLPTITPTTDSNQKTLTWTFPKGVQIPSGYNIDIKYSYLGVEFKKELTILASKGQPIYQLKPSVSDLRFSRNSSNTLSAPPAVKLKVVKIDNESTTEYDSAITDIVVRYSKTSMPTSYDRSGDSNWDWTNGVSVSTADVANGVTDLHIAMFRKVSNTVYVLVDRETIPVVKDGLNGEGQVRIDLDNENDSMLYTSKGDLVSGNVNSTAYLFDGARDVSTSASWTVTPTNCTVSSGNSRNIVVTGMSAASAYVTVQAVYTDSYSKQHTVSARLTLKKIVDGDKYDLVIEPHSIPYNITTDTPSASTLSISVYRTYIQNDGTVKRDLSAPPTGYKVYANGTEATATSTTGKYTYTTDNSAISEVVVKIAKTASSTDILDLETIPVVKAENGKNSVRIDLDNQADLVSLDSEGKVRFGRTIVVKARVYDGGSSPTSGVSKDDTLTADNLRFGSSTTGCTPTVSAVSSGVVTITWVFKKEMVITADTKNISLKYGNVTYTAVFTLGTTDADAIWQVMPNPSEVSFTKNSSNVLTPSSQTLKCGYTKSTGSGTESVAEATVTSGQIGSTGMYLYYRTRGSNNSWGSWSVYTTSGIPVSSSTTVKDYEFCISTATSSGSVADGNIIDRECVPVVKDGIDGASPYLSDLDNEMDSVPCTYGGVTTAAYDKYINVSLWHGTTPEDLTTLTTSAAPTNVTITPDKTKKRIRIQVSKDVQLAERSDITITIASANSGNKTLHFILNGVRGGVNGEPAVIFSLVPSTSSIKRDKSNTLSPASPMTCDVRKIVGNDASKRATSSDGTLRYRVDGDITSSTQGDSLTINSGTVAYTSSNKYIVFAFFVGTTLVDKERVPIIYDGEDGTSPYFADLDNEMDSIACDVNGHPTSEQHVETNLAMYHGITPIDFSVAIKLNGNSITTRSSYSSASSAYTNGIQVVYSSKKLTIYYATAATINGRDEYTIDMTASDGSSTKRTLTFTVNGIRPGSDGKSPTIYNLLPSQSQISVGRTSSGGYNPSTASLTCGYTERTGDSEPKSYNDVTGAIGTYYAIFFRRRTRGSSGSSSSSSSSSSSGNAISRFSGEVMSNSTEKAPSLTDGSTGTYILYGNSKDSKEVIVKVSFSASSATTVRITATPSSEANWDKGYVGPLGSTTPTTNPLLTVSGTSASSTDVNVSAGNNQFFYISYKKDGSTSIPDDCVTFTFQEVVSGGGGSEPVDTGGGYEDKYFRYGNSTHKTKVTSLDVTSYDAVEFILYKDTTSNTLSSIDNSKLIDRETVPVVSDGKEGVSQTDYEIHSTVDSVTIAKDVTTGSLSTTFTFWKKIEGVLTQTSYYYGFYYRKGSNYYWLGASTVTANSYSVSNEKIGGTGAVISSYTEIDAFVIIIGNSGFSLSTKGTAVTFPSNYLAKLEIPVIKQGDTGPEGIGEDGYSVVASPAAVVLSESLTSENSFSLPQYIEFSVQGNSSVSVSNVAVDSMSNVTASRDNTYNNRIKITAVTTTNKPTQGYVVTNVSLSDGTTKSVKVLVAINWQGTIKTSIEGSVETTVAEAVNTAIEEGDFVTTETLGYYVRSDSESYVGLQRSVNGAVTDASEAKQTADEIKLTVSGNGENTLLNSMFNPSDGDSSINYYPESWEASSSSVYAKKNDYYKEGHKLYLASGGYIQQLILSSSAQRVSTGSSYSTLSFYWGRYSSANAILRVYFYTSGGDVDENVEVDGVNMKLTKETGVGYYAEFNTPEYAFKRHVIRFTFSNYQSISSAYIRFKAVSYASWLVWPQMYKSVASGIDIKNDVVDVLADNFTVHNSAGEQTMGLDAKGDFEVSGTVKAKNLFRSLAVASKYGTSAQSRIKVFDTSGNANVWLYIKSTFSYGGKSFAAGTYHTWEEIGSSYDIDSNFGKCCVCTYSADEVFVTYNSIAMSAGENVTVYLPRCQDFGGKTVIIRNNISSGVQNPYGVTVTQCDGYSLAMASVALTMNDFNISTGNSQETRTMTAGQTAIFYSNGSRWELVALWPQ